MLWAFCHPMAALLLWGERAMYLRMMTSKIKCVLFKTHSLVSSSCLILLSQGWPSPSPQTRPWWASEERGLLSSVDPHSLVQGHTAGTGVVSRMSLVHMQEPSCALDLSHSAIVSTFLKLDLSCKIELKSDWSSLKSTHYKDFWLACDNVFIVARLQVSCQYEILVSIIR